MTKKNKPKVSDLQEKHRLVKYSWALAWCMMIIAALYVLLKIGIISLSWVHSFEEAVAIKYAKTPLLHEFMTETNFNLNPDRYQLARWLFLLLFPTILLLPVLLFKYQKKWQPPLISFCKLLLPQIYATWKSYQELNRLQKVFLHLVLLISLAMHIFLVFYLPPHVDELETYYVFVKEGLVWTSIFYPFPNNHVFFNYFFWLSDLFIADPLLAARIPSVIFYQILLLLIFFGVRRYLKNTEAAFGSLLLCLALFPSGIYGSQGRGYILFSILLLISAYALLIALEDQKWQKYALSVFVISSSLGAYTIPVFLLPFISMLMLAGLKMFFKPDKVLIVRLVLSIMIVGILVGFLYLPIFLFSGIGSVVSNKYILPSQASDFYSYITPIATAEILSYLAAVSSKGWLIWLILGITGISTLVKCNYRVRNWLLLSAFMVFTIIIYGLLMRSFMYERTATYAVYLLYPSAILILLHYLNRFVLLRIKRGIYFLLLFTLPILVYQQYQHNTYEGSLLPSTHSDVIIKYNRIAVEKDWTVFFSGTYWDLQLSVMAYHYFSELHNQQSRRVSDYHEADMVVIESGVIEGRALQLQGYQQVEEILEQPGEFQASDIWLKKEVQEPL